MSKLRLVSFDVCPYVQRAAIVLENRGVPYEIEYIDLSNKPAWFLEISPLGKVPLLQVDGHVLFESAVIAEYLDETTGGALLPSDPLPRAVQRMWSEFISAALVDVWKLSVAADEEAGAGHAAALRSKLERLEGVIAGPYFAGTELSLADAAAAPLLQRMTWCEELAPQLGMFTGLAKVSAWRDALVERPDVLAAAVPDLRERFLGYSKRGSGGVPGWLGGLA